MIFLQDNPGRQQVFDSKTTEIDRIYSTKCKKCNAIPVHEISSDEMTPKIHYYRCYLMATVLILTISI